MPDPLATTADPRDARRVGITVAGRQRWTNTPPSRPTGPGVWMLTYTITGRALYRYPPRVELATSPGDLILLRRDTPGTRGVPEKERWDALWLRFDPWSGWTPAGFERIADGLHRRHIAPEGHRLAMQEIWPRIIAAVRERETARALAAVATVDRGALRAEERIPPSSSRCGSASCSSSRGGSR